MEIVQFGLKMGEDVTGLPLLLQGQQGEAPDTLGGMQLVNNNASTVLRRLAKLSDDMITEPHVRRYYVWIMQYGEDAEKGDYQIDARGSSALVERDLQNQAIVQMGQIVTNPAFGVNPRKWFAQYARSQRLDPKDFQYTDEEQKKLDEMAQQGPTDPRVAVAQIRGQIDEKLETIRSQAAQQILMLEKKFEAAENDKDRQLDSWVARLEQAGAKSISLDQLKARLADTAVKIRAQRDLSAQSRDADFRKHVTPPAAKPPTEPAGRAKPGQAFQR